MAIKNPILLSSQFGSTVWLESGLRMKISFIVGFVGLAVDFYS